MLCLDLPEELNNRLELLSLSTGRTIQFYIHESILEYLDDIEDRYLTMGLHTGEAQHQQVDEDIEEGLFIDC